MWSGDVAFQRIRYIFNNINNINHEMRMHIHTYIQASSFLSFVFSCRQPSSTFSFFSSPLPLCLQYQVYEKTTTPFLFCNFNFITKFCNNFVILFILLFRIVSKSVVFRYIENCGSLSG